MTEPTARGESLVTAANVACETWVFPDLLSMNGNMAASTVRWFVGRLWDRL
ncbi:MAG TPA: hypothetical protein VK540_26775 [Polyangiaceae bacterium]|nr:hypothetical protein [Polyangiaceae bacterium]